MPWEAVEVEEGEPFTIIEKKALEIRSMAYEIHFHGNKNL